MFDAVRMKLMREYTRHLYHSALTRRHVHKSAPAKFRSRHYLMQHAFTVATFTSQHLPSSAVFTCIIVRPHVATFTSQHLPAFTRRRSWHARAQVSACKFTRRRSQVSTNQHPHATVHSMLRIPAQQFTRHRSQHVAPAARRDRSHAHLVDR